MNSKEAAIAHLDASTFLIENAANAQAMIHTSLAMLALNGVNGLYDVIVATNSHLQCNYWTE